MQSTFVMSMMLFCMPLLAQRRPDVDSLAKATSVSQTNTYGTQGETAQTMFNQDFNPNIPSTTWDVAPVGWLKYVSNNGGCCLEAPLLLPAGATITAIELEGCDTSVTAALAATLVTCPGPAGASCTPGGGAATGTAAVPGCAFFRSNLTTPLTVNNAANTYFVQEDNVGDTTGTVSFRAVRIYYKLQVSPAPGTATFTDVPATHIFYQYIEALAASGITAGCAAGQYCPDATLTRGQMAVFLSKALGLHFAP
jgi:hypothetical protein